MASYNKRQHFSRLPREKENISVVDKKSSIISGSNKIHQLLKPWESKEDVHPKRRHLSENASIVSSQAIHDGDKFPKPDFKIYSSNEEVTDLKKLTITNIATIKKNINLIKQHQTEKEIKGRSYQKLKNPQVQKLLAADTNTYSTITPEDSLCVPLKINQIKLQHKRSALDEKYIKKAVDSFSPELIYNLEYTKDFMAFQLELERSHKTSPKFLNKNVTYGQRRTIIYFLIKVTAYCNYPCFILYQTVKIFDTMLDSKIIATEQLQLVALTALWVSLKRLHTHPNIPTADEILSFSKHVYQKQELYNCEMDMMMTLKFEISYIDPFSILVSYFINMSNPFIRTNRTDLLYYCGSYMIDISLLSVSLCNVSPIALIVAAAEIALFIILAHEDDLKHPHWQYWRGCLPDIFSKRWDMDNAVITETRKKMIKLALLSKNSSTDYAAVYKKYKRSRYGHISEIVIGKLSKVSHDDYDS